MRVSQQARRRPCHSSPSRWPSPSRLLLLPEGEAHGPKRSSIVAAVTLMRPDHQTSRRQLARLSACSSAAEAGRTPPPPSSGANCSSGRTERAARRGGRGTTQRGCALRRLTSRTRRGMTTSGQRRRRRRLQSQARGRRSRCRGPSRVFCRAASACRRMTVAQWLAQSSVQPTQRDPAKL